MWCPYAETCMYQLGENFACPMEVSSMLETQMEGSSMLCILRVDDAGDVSRWAQLSSLWKLMLKADRTQNYLLVKSMDPADSSQGNRNTSSFVFEYPSLEKTCLFEY